MSESKDPWELKSEVFEKSYDEVLAALKHQDDKLNRTLTALAFLTAAAIALFTNYASKLHTVRFQHEPPIPVTTFFFVVFLGAALFALLFALAAIGPSDALPKLEWPQRERQKKPEKGPKQGQQKESRESLIFYARILNDPKWDTYIKQDPSWLRETLASNLHAEAKLLSHRVAYKVARSRESSACVQLAVLALILLGVFAARPMSLSTRWWVASALLITVLIQPFWDALMMWWFKFKEDKNPLTERWRTYACVGVGVAASTVALATAPWLHGHWWAIGAALGTILTTRLTLAHAELAIVLLPATAAGAVAAAVLAWAV